MSEDRRIERFGLSAWKAMHDLVRELMARKPGSHLVEGSLREIDVHVALPLSGSADDQRRFAGRLAGALERTLDEAVQHAAAFRPGHAYCHRCRSPECEHSVPPSSRDVFAGYAPTGLPRWRDFAQFCLDRRHPEVDRLFDRPPALVTLVQDRDELHGGLLRAFDDGRYELLGQVIAGYFPAGTNGNGRGVVALTVQAATSRALHGRRRVGLNLLGRAPDGGALESLWQEGRDLPWRRAVRWAQTALRTLDRTPRGRGAAGREALERRVEGILRGLARRLDSDSTSRSRRTRHAERRHASGERPTRKAVDDARRADLASFLVDERAGTLVVLGERGRTHFFTDGGQHVSSVRYSRDALARKTRLGIWRPGTPEQLETFRKKLPD